MQSLEFRHKAPRIFFLIAAVLVLLPVGAKADVANKQSSDAPMSVRRHHVHYEVKADGSYTEHGEMRMAADPSFSMMSVGGPGFSIDNAGKRTLIILEAYTLKKNGERINAVELAPKGPNGVASEAPAIHEARWGKTMKFQGMEAGDEVVYSYKAIQSEPVIPAHFVTSHSFPTFRAHDDVEISLDAPTSIKLRVEAKGIEGGAKQVAGDVQKWVWKYQNKNPEGLTPGQPITFAQLYVTSFASEAEQILAVQNRRLTASPQPVKVASAASAAPVAGKVRPEIDMAMGAVPASYPRPVSEWKATEKTIYQKLLSGGRFDVLVVPFQVQGYALDRATRSLMTAELVLAMSMTDKARIPDPYLVARALGEGNRRLDPNDVYSLADKIGARKIIWGYVGHDRKHKMSLTIQMQERRKDGVLNGQVEFATTNFADVAFSDERPPIEMYQSMLPEILRVLGGRSTLAASTRAARFDETELPPTPLAMLAKKPEHIRDAYYFQLLAYLTPDDEERTRERFAEKSLLAILGVSPDSPDYRAVKARAFYLLGLRPAALQVLAKPATVEEQELVAVLNGNLPEVESLSLQAQPGIRKLITQLDAIYLASQYGTGDRQRAKATASSSALPGKIWPLLATRAYSDLDNWSQFGNIDPKLLLDHEFPIKEYTAEGMMRGAATLGDTGKLRMLTDFSVLNHVRKLLENDAATWCCQTMLGHPAAMDYLNLIEAIGDDNLMRRASYLTNTQGLPEQALEFLSRIENVYKGNPRYSMLCATAQIKRAEAVDGAERDGLLRSAYTNAFNAMYWEQGQTLTSAWAIYLLPNTRQQSYGYFDNYFASDYPYRAYYSNWEHGGQAEYMIPNAEAKLKNSSSHLGAIYDLYNWYRNDAQKSDALFRSVEGRFIGNPSLSQLRATHSKMMGDDVLEEKYYREGIKYQPDSWDSYLSLGSLLIKQGRVNAAAELFMNYPAFKPGSKENPVGISNSAFKAGSEFYWLGETALAAPFYQIAIRQPTGSSADLISQLRLKLISGDYRGALSGYLDLMNRYNDAYAYADYLGMLYAMGASKEAWDAFNALSGQVDGPQIWETVLVGHRKQGKTEGEIATWVRQQVGHNIGRKGDQAAKYLLRAGVTDRVPDKALAASLAAVELPTYGDSGRVIQPSADGRVNYILGPTGAGNFLPINTTFRPSPKNRIKSDLGYFAESYRAIRVGDIALARSLLREAAALYDLAGDRSSFLLPYYAFAAAKMGDAAAIENHIRNFSVDKKGYDYYLARAVVAGIGGRVEESVQHLKSALYRRPYTEGRPVYAEYQYAEICEWLYEATGKSQYRELALDWARKFQKIKPWFAWAYAMEAKLSNRGPERAHALAMTMYLDPQSERLRKIPKQEKDAAAKKFNRTNPFMNMRDSVERSAI